MKHFLTAILLLVSLFANAQSSFYSLPQQPTTTYYSTPSPSTYSTNPSVEYRSGYTNSNGTYVKPYRAMQRDNTNWNDFRTQGNVNPYTNQAGTRARLTGKLQLRTGQNDLRRPSWWPVLYE